MMMLSEFELGFTAISKRQKRLANRIFFIFRIKYRIYDTMTFTNKQKIDKIFENF